MLNRFMRRVYVQLVVLVMVLGLLSACSTFSNLQEDWDKLTPEQQGRVVLNSLQDSVQTWLTAGKSFVALHPEYKEDWQNKIIPLFDIANKSISTALIYKKAPSEIYSTVSPTVAAVISALTAWGVTADTVPATTTTTK